MVRHDVPARRDGPLVTVVTVAFNAAHTLRDTLDSVLAQDYPRIQYVVVDGNSTDGSRALLLEYEARLDTLVIEDDAGIAAAMNKAIGLARGDYLVFLHADDVFAGDDALTCAIDSICAQPGADVYACCIDIRNDAGRRRVCARRWLAALYAKQSVPHQGALCRRQLFAQIGHFDESLMIAMDYDFFLRAYRAGKRIQRLPQVLSVMGGHGVSSRIDPDSLRARLAEERRVHQAHAAGFWLRSFYRVYWALYPAYKGWRLFGDRHLLAGD